MGSPLVADGDDVNAAKVNQFIAAPGGKLSVFVWYGRVRYNGSSWEVYASTDSAKLSTGALAWNTNQLQITLTDFAAPPVILASPPASDSAYHVKAHASSSVLGIVRFYAVADDTLITTEDTDMDCQLLIIGTYV